MNLREACELAVKTAVGRGASYADARAERLESTVIRYLHDGFDQVSSGSSEGLGIRALHKGAWGFSTIVSLEKAAIKEAADSAVRAANTVSKRAKKRAKVAEGPAYQEEGRIKVRKPLLDVPLSEKMKVTLGIASATRRNRRVTSSNAIYAEVSGWKATAVSQGTSLLFPQSRSYLSVRAIAKRGAKMTSASEYQGIFGGFEAVEKTNIEAMARKAAQRAVRALDAKPAPSRRFTAVIDPRLAGTFIHEAVGHACEADHVVTGESILKGRIGTKIGSDLITAYDDSTISNGWGSAEYDDEGFPTERRLLVEKGVLRGYILNRETATTLKMKPNGGGRAQSFSSPPLVRMSNTYIARGDWSHEELLEDVKQGVYLAGSRGGEVDPAKGNFQFNAEDAFMIEKGELTQPLMEVSLSGMIMETLHSIDGVGRDLKLNPGFCGKGYQSVPVGDGSPHIRIQNAIIGGRG